MKTVVLAHQQRSGMVWSPALIAAAAVLFLVVAATALTGHRRLSLLIAVLTAAAAFRAAATFSSTHVDLAVGAQAVCRNPAPLTSDPRTFALPVPPPGYDLVRTSEVPAPVDGRHCWVQRVTVPTGDPAPAMAALYTFEGDGGPAPEALVGPHSTAKTRGTRTVWARTGRDPQTGTLIGAAAWHEDGVDILLRTTGAGEELTVRLAASAVIGPSPLAGDGRRVATISEPAATVAFEGHPADLPTVGVAKTMVVYSGLGPVSSLSPTEVVAASGRQLVVQTWRGQDLDAESLVAGQGAAQVEVNGQAGYVFTTAVPATDGGPGVPTERAVLVLESDAGPLAVLDGDGMTPDQLVTLAQELMLQ